MWKNFKNVHVKENIDYYNICTVNRIFLASTYNLMITYMLFIRVLCTVYTIQNTIIKPIHKL